ncbi:NUDIX hydrolase [Salmonirosea aquatica]|uniref:NUDIX domain-containing protein n=1 Tax=Salmonirosea aquatica TaxID=2654236 RepID=A0A7C9BLG5_9BACT|nr:NUDIX domain-containing protein [Cytophagaceae bacterium SJW1-29]
MILFLNDRPVKIIRLSDFDSAETDQYDSVLDLRLSRLREIRFSGHVVLLNVTPSLAAQIIELLDNHPEDLLSLTLVSTTPKEITAKIKSMYKVIKAAGGVVLKNNQWLVMYRRKAWDFPKGKLDRDERSRKAAVREIEEETGVKARIKAKICTTWHTYTFQNSRILKRTKWYVLECVNDSNMAPQTEEDIEKLEWMAYPQVQQVLINSFSSIRYVADRLHRMQTQARSM